MKNKILNFLKEKQPVILTFVLVVLLISNCNQRSREKEIVKMQEETNLQIDDLSKSFSNELDSISKEFKKALKIEGLKGELRAIEASDRKIFDLKRQNEIRKEIEKLENEK
jgi:hypothetical protein